MSTPPRPADAKLPKYLSPSRAKDYMQCPLKYYYKSILKLPDPPGLPAVAGTVSHTVLEEVMALPREQRSAAWARDQVWRVWGEEYRRHLDRGHPPVVAEGPPSPQLRETSTTADEPPQVGDLLGLVRMFVSNAFELERLHNFDPAGIELDLKMNIGKVPVRGKIDRFDRVESNGREYLFVSDYKTGRWNPRYRDDAFFAMYVYALMIEQEFGQVPYRLRLLFLKYDNPEDGVQPETVTPFGLEKARKKLTKAWEGIQRDFRTGNWATRTGPLCNWCPYQDICPEFAPQAAERLSERLDAEGAEDRVA